MKRKKWLIGLLVVVVVVVVVGGRFAKNFLFENIGLVSRIVDPISPNREVVWEKGPAEAEKSLENRPPNIILIMADDLGANDVTFAGGGVANGAVPTPNIDSIGREGVSFTNGYAGNATCAPSRASVLTGRYASRIGFEFTPAPAAFMKFFAEKQADGPHPPKYFEEREDEVPDYTEESLPPSEITMAELLNSNGYHSVMLGKWHLGDKEGKRPGDQGFDEFLGFTAGAALYAPKDDPNIVNSIQEFDPIDVFQWKALSANVRTNEGGRFKPKGYLTDYLANEAVKTIENNTNRPFFMYLAFNAPHTPLQATRADYEALSQIENHTLRVYAAMIRALDRGVGRVLETLKKNGLEENTIVVFTSDNGGASYLGLPDLNKPYRGWKMTFFEGGVNVPFFMKWPSRIPKGTTYEQPVMQLDIFATVAAATGSTLPTDRKIDGVDLVPYVNGEVKGIPHEVLFWHDGGYQSVMAGDWKLQVVEQTGQNWLFNLKNDPTEKFNLAKTQPDKAKALQALLTQFNQSEKSKPLWPSLLEGTMRVDRTVNQPWEKDDEWVVWSN